MITITDKRKCSGCHACYSVCPKQCIEMKSDAEGFWYPSVDASLCIQCGLCTKVCPILQEKQIEETTTAYACFNQNMTVRLQSSSGGVFSLLAQKVLLQDGVVFGAQFNDDLSVSHAEIHTIEEIEKLRGSKYQQSKIEDTYIAAKKYLDANKLVYFSGTPCQIDGLKAYLKKDYDCLICQDIICHGVPSPKVFQQYLKEKNAYFKEKPESMTFREKVLDWENYAIRIDYPSKSFVRTHKDDLYMKVFLQDLSLRPSCFACHSKGVQRNSDITLADFWGIDKVFPEMSDKKGTSLVILHSDKGRELFKEIQSSLICKEVDVNEAGKYNPSLYQSVNKPKKRDVFMETLESEDFSVHAKKYLKKNRVKTVKRILKKVINKLRKR